MAIKRDPLEVLRMGSHFGTCLDLHQGINALLLVANVADVNKAVVYVRRNNDKVVARKLIGLTGDGEMAGHHTYSHEHPKEMRKALVDTLATFAETIGARLSETATPGRLGGGFWYDDGNESWAVPVPIDEPPTDPVSVWRARRDLDATALQQMAAHGSGHGAAIAAAHKGRQADGQGQPTELGRLEAGQRAAVFEAVSGKHAPLPSCPLRRCSAPAFKPARYPQTQHTFLEYWARDHRWRSPWRPPMSPPRW